MNAGIATSTSIGPGIGITTGTTIDGPELPPADRLVEVLLPELLRTLGERGPCGSVLGGRPHLRLFGEAIDLALPLRALRRASEAAWGSSLYVDDDALALHARATAAEDGYLLSAAGMYAALGRGADGEEDVPSDAMSLRLYTSRFCRPMNALLRADPARPESWLAVVAELRDAARRHAPSGDRSRGDRARLDRPEARAFARRMVRLREGLVGLTRIDDPRLPRVLGELVVHALMAVRALGRQRAYACEGDQPGRLFRACVLPDAALADLRWAAAGGGGAWRDLGLLSTSPREDLCRRFGRARHPHMLEIRPRFRGSTGRWLDGQEPQVVFPPGTPFEVIEVVEAPRDDGGPLRIAARLVELVPRGASRTTEER